jgi:hypothetical protein
MRYTYSEDDDEGSDALSSRISTRPSGISTPAEHAGPVTTASGRQVKSRLGGMYGESILVDQRKEIEHERAQALSHELGSDVGRHALNGRLRRSTRPARPSRRRVVDGDDGDLEDESEAESTGDDWSGDEDEPDEPEPDFEGDDEDDEMSTSASGTDDEDVEDAPPKSLVVQLRYAKKTQPQQDLNGLPNHTNPQQEAVMMEGPPALVPMTPGLEPRPSYSPSSLPHHFSPTSHSQPFTNGSTFTGPQDRASQKPPEHLLHPQPQTFQFSKAT